MVKVEHCHSINQSSACFDMRDQRFIDKFNSQHADLRGRPCNQHSQRSNVLHTVVHGTTQIESTIYRIHILPSAHPRTTLLFYVNIRQHRFRFETRCSDVYRNKKVMTVTKSLKRNETRKTEKKQTNSPAHTLGLYGRKKKQMLWPNQGSNLESLDIERIVVKRLAIGPLGQLFCWWKAVHLC